MCDGHPDLLPATLDVIQPFVEHLLERFSGIRYAHDNLDIKTTRASLSQLSNNSHI
jgi:hypothetical protein